MLEKPPFVNDHWLDIRHVSIVDALPIYETKKEILNVGCGVPQLDQYLADIGWNVTPSDYIPERNKYPEFEERMRQRGITLKVVNTNIFDLSSFPKDSYECVICSEVLEHLEDYKTAFRNLLQLTERRLILTFPWARSFMDAAPPPKGHCNFWNDDGTAGYKNVHELVEMAKPYATSVQKIRTKPRDVELNQLDYLVIVDKQQAWNV